MKTFELQVKSRESGEYQPFVGGKAQSRRQFIRSIGGAFYTRKTGFVELNGPMKEVITGKKQFQVKEIANAD